MTTFPTCKNCNNEFDSTDSYCRNCGQVRNVHRFTLGHIAHEFFHAFTHTDKSIFALIAGLLIRPGNLVAAYLNGQRKTYFNPFTFLLLVAAFSMLVLAWTGPQHPPSDAGKPATGMQLRAQEVGRFMSKRQNLIMIIAVPFNAAIFFLAYRRKGRNYAEHLVANVFFVAIIILITSVVFYPLMGLFPKPPELYFVLYGMLLSHIVFYSLAYGQLFSLRGWKSWLGVVLVSILSILLWSGLTRWIIRLYIQG